MPQARVAWIEHLGDQNYLHLKLGEREIVTLADPHIRMATGDTVSLQLRDPLFFDAAGDRIETSTRPGGRA